MRASRLAATCAVLLLAGGCTRPPPRFNPLPTGQATAPAPPPSLAPTGSSNVVIAGEMNMRSTVDYQCSFAIDDFFIRGRLGDYEGMPVYLSINVEFYKKPGTYAQRTQVLLRRISSDNTFYASWYYGKATMTVLPGGKGATIDAVTTLPPEPGTQSTRPTTLKGRFGCLGSPAPGPG